MYLSHFSDISVNSSISLWIFYKYFLIIDLMSFRLCYRDLMNLSALIDCQQGFHHFTVGIATCNRYFYANRFFFFLTLLSYGILLRLHFFQLNLIFEMWRYRQLIQLHFWISVILLSSLCNRIYFVVFFHTL